MRLFFFPVPPEVRSSRVPLVTIASNYSPSKSVIMIVCGLGDRTCYICEQWSEYGTTTTENSNGKTTCKLEAG